MLKNILISALVFPLSLLCAFIFGEHQSAGWLCGALFWPVTFVLLCLWDMIPDTYCTTATLYSEAELQEFDRRVEERMSFFSMFKPSVAHQH